MSNLYQTNSEQNLLSPELAAEYLGGASKPLSQATLALWRRKGVGPTFIRVGKSIRYPLSKLNEFLNEMTVSRIVDGDQND